MILYNFDIQNGKVRIYESSNDSEIELSNPFIDRQNTLLYIYSDSVLVKKLSFIEFGTIDGVVPTNLDNAGDLINSLINSVNMNSVTVANQLTQPLTDTQLRATPVQVTVTNQIDLTTITGYLLAIKNSVANIDVNTDTIESKITDTITAINSNGTVNHADLLLILAQLQAVNTNTDTLEAGLTSILNKIIAAPATLAEQQTQTTQLRNLNSVIEEIQQTGFYRGKIAYVFMILGRRVGFSSNTLFNDVGEAIGISGSNSFPILNGTETLQLISSNAADAAAGTGVRTVKVTYIDTSNNLVESASITLNGITAVNCGFNANAVLWIESQTVGSNGAAVGNITLRTSAPLSLIQITANGNKSMDSFFMIPSGYTGYLTAWNGSCIANEQDLRIRATVNTLDRSVTPNVYHFQDNKYLPANTSEEIILPNLKMPALAKIKCSTISASTAGATRIESGFIIILIQN